MRITFSKKHQIVSCLRGGAIFLTLVLILASSSFADDPTSEEIDLKRNADQINIVLFGALVPVVLAFSFFIFIFYRIKREDEVKKRELALEYSGAQMELKALKAQVNPHFIFNCLNSIILFLKNHDREETEEFVLKFSRLIREVLENSENSEISLAEDLETLKNYIEMEKMRTGNRFHYSLTMGKNLDPGVIMIPPLLIQPLIENAIWHGVDLEKGNIELKLSIEDGMLNCKILNDGTDSNSSTLEVHPFKKKSFGIKLITERLQLLNDTQSTKAELKIVNNRDEIPNNWTNLVELSIPLKTKNYS